MTYADVSQFAKKRRVDAGVRPVRADLTRPISVWVLLNLSRVDLMHGGYFDRRVWSFFGGAWVCVVLTRRWCVQSSFLASDHHLS